MECNCGPEQEKESDVTVKHPEERWEDGTCKRRSHFFLFLGSNNNHNILLFLMTYLFNIISLFDCVGS